MIEVIDLDENDADFLSIIDSIETEAIKASRTKRQKIKIEKEEEEEEGAYMAALKGSHSSAWKKNVKQQQNNYYYNDNSNSSNRKKNYNENVSIKEYNGDADVAEKQCVCGTGLCLVLTSNTAKNPGRKFYRCPVRQENGGCDFFEWCDNSSSGLPSSGRASTEGSGSYGISKFSTEPSSISRQSSYNNYSSTQTSTERKGSSCFKCGQEGHWARDCTRSSDSHSMPGNNLNSSNSGSSCFKCGQEGHWARDCTRSSDSYSMPGNNLNSSNSGSCFKCGKSGHWAKDCTEEQNYNSSGGVKKNTRSSFQTPAKKYN